MLSESAQRKIMLADATRAISRRQAEDELLSHDSSSRAALADWTCETPLKRGSGLIPLSDTRRKTPRRAPRVTVHGAAAMPPDADAAARLAAGDVEDTVLCYNLNTPDAEPTIRTVASFRGQRESTKNRATPSQTRTVDTTRDNVQPAPRFAHNFND